MCPHLQVTTALLVAVAGTATVMAQERPSEADFYPLLTYTLPPNEVLEVGAITELPDGIVAFVTRRGEIWLVANALAADPQQARFTRWAHGLHEPLGLAWRDGWLYVVQRGEVSRLKDTNNDGQADLFEVVSEAWGITGDHHEYNFGSQFDKDGNLWVVLCLTGSHTSEAPFRGWCLRITPEGEVIPTCSGIRSPGGIGANLAGDMFYTDNQGWWNGTSALKHLQPGKFLGNPAGNRWYELAPGMGPRPADPHDKSRFHIEAKRIPEYLPPAILFPHAKVGQSASGIACDASEGKFGPFAGQLFVSDQTYSLINRVFLEKIDGLYQGACFPFREGFSSGNVPTIQASDGSLLVGGTNRGWGSRGTKPFALERLIWSGKTPFEVKEMRIRPWGFDLIFTLPVDRTTAADPASYALKTYTYIYQAGYGSPEVDATTPIIAAAEVSDDGLTVALKVEGLQIGHVHELDLPGVRSAREGWPLLHPKAYYTLWKIPVE
ncbi:large, multifunctional secreted protein [Isosphaera pallida ATCC 43644]|uniref:Large, multifunctional secreted protein n=1 Tax=Isosphaera pallida (strain ATCC 43644 / DSM 9630 / IS1B) TaxID=575540 RepID=E8R303_ISOPI|nr:hypothetical protein [Isosphaera pallida]ADV61507.1 large, multifunctional secreted protein [Isosphaera pallida ATCC 43644]